MGASPRPGPFQAEPAAAAVLKAAHRRRLRELWRSAGWPVHDPLELDLLAAGMLSRHWDPQGRETLRVTDAGLQWLAAARQRHQASLGAHEALVAQVAREMHRAGRVVWRGLSLRAPLMATPAVAVAVAAAAEEQPTPRRPHETQDFETQGLPLAAMPGVPPATPGPFAAKPTWVVARPDVFSIRHTTVEDYTEPVVHEIKVSRADLLSDLRSPAKGAAYRALASQCWYVLRQGIAEADELPEAFGVMVASDSGLVVARPAPRSSVRLPFAVWMLLARAVPEEADDESDQPALALPQDGLSSCGLSAEMGSRSGGGA